MNRLKFALLLAFAALACLSGIAQQSDFKGKTMVVVGDSYVFNHHQPWSETWHAKVANRLKMFYFNYGRNGRAIVFDRTGKGSGKPIIEFFKEMPDNADYVLVIAGHNDANFVTRYDATLDDFAKGFRQFGKELREKYPEAKIGFVLPWNLDKPNFKEVREEITKACGEMGFPVLNIDGDGLIKVNDPAFRAEFFQDPDDTAHLNGKGHDLVVPIGLDFVKSL